MERFEESELMVIAGIIPPEVMQWSALTYLKITPTDIEFFQAAHREAVVLVGFDCLSKWNKEKCGPDPKKEFFWYLRKARNTLKLAAKDFEQICAELNQPQYARGKCMFLLLALLVMFLSLLALLVLLLLLQHIKIN